MITSIVNKFCSKVLHQIMEVSYISTESTEYTLTHSSTIVIAKKEKTTAVVHFMDISHCLIKPVTLPIAEIIIKSLDKVL